MCEIKVFRQMCGLPVHHTNAFVFRPRVSEASDINTVVSTASVIKHITTVGLLRGPDFLNV
jgi:hypothetical protein